MKDSHTINQLVARAESNRPAGHYYWHWFFIGLIAAVAFVLGYIGLCRAAVPTGLARTRWDLLYLTLQLFWVQGGNVPSPVPWQLELARFLAPTVPALTLLKTVALIFRDQRQMFRLRFLTKGHVVVCGLGLKGLQFVKDFRRQGHTVVVIELNADSNYIRSCRDLGATVLIGNAIDKNLLAQARVQRARLVVAITGDEGTNVETAMRVHQLVRASDGKQRQPVTCFVHVVTLKLCRLFKNHQIFTETDDPFEAHIFNIYENSARFFLEDFPLDRGQITVADEKYVHLITVGFGQTGESVVLQAAKTGHYANGLKPRLTVIDLKADEQRSGFLGRYPQFGQVCDLEFVQGDIEAPEILDQIQRWTSDHNAVATVVVCLNGDSRSLLCALAVLSKLEPTRVPICVRMAENAGLATLLDQRHGAADWVTHVHAFGMTSITCTKRMILNEEQDNLAEAIHEDYCQKRIAEGKQPADDPALAPWQRLDPHFREANRAQADHILVKLRAIGCESSPPRPGQEPVVEFSDEKIEILSRMEHARWNAEKFLANWTQGPRDLEQRTSPHLVDWAELPDDIKEYDREAVRNIPQLLERIGEKIYHRPNPDDS